jgi:hypothetical protein
MGEPLWLAGEAFFIARILTPIMRDTLRSYNRIIPVYPHRFGGAPKPRDAVVNS